jgi:hypothetical protein
MVQQSIQESSNWAFGRFAYKRCCTHLNETSQAVIDASRGEVLHQQFLHLLQMMNRTGQDEIVGIMKSRGNVCGNHFASNLGIPTIFKKKWVQICGRFVLFQVVEKHIVQPQHGTPKIQEKGI